MGVIFKLTGDDALGQFDHEVGSLHPDIVLETAGGRSRYLVKTSVTVKIAGKSPLGNRSTYYFGIWADFTGNPAGASQVFVHCLNSGGTNAFRLRRGSTGTIILDGAVTNSLATSPVIPAAPFLLVGSIAPDSGTVTIYAADGTTVLGTLSATGTGIFGALDNWRMGQMAGSPAIPDWGFRLLVGDTPITAAMVLETSPPVVGEKFFIGGDSLTSMSGANGTYVYTELVASGIPPENVYFWGVGGKRISVPSTASTNNNGNAKTTMQNIQDARAALGTIDTFLIALGQNDVPFTSPEIEGYVDALLAEIGAGPKVVWISLSALQTASADHVRINGILQAKLAARPNSFLADWNAYIRSVDGGANPSPLWDVDGIHMTPLGYQTQRAPYFVDQLVDDGPTPDPVDISDLSNADAERVYLLRETGLPATASLADLRREFYGPNEHGWFAQVSGLAKGSLADHQVAFYRAQLGVSGGGLSALARAYWASELS